VLGTGAALAVADELMLARDRVEVEIRARLPQGVGATVVPRLGLARDDRVRHSTLFGNVTAMFLPPLFVAAWAAIGVESCIADSEYERWGPPVVGLLVFFAVSGSVVATVRKRRRSLEAAWRASQ
jgi:hypothetical protein